MVKKKDDITVLERKCAQLRKKLHSRDSIELTEQLGLSLVDLALLYQQNSFDWEQIISTAVDAVKLLEESSSKKFIARSRAHRILAETYAEEKKRSRKALEEAENFYITARASGNHSQIQLALHVKAWVVERIWLVSGKKATECELELMKALGYCDESIEYIKEFGKAIQRDKQAVEDAGTIDIRMANVQRLASGIAGNLGLQQRAERYWKPAMKIAESKKLLDLKYELRLAQLDFSWVDKEDVAKRLVNEAPSKKKGYAILEQGQVLIYKGKFNEAFTVLLDCYARFRDEFRNDEDMKILEGRLILLSRLVETRKQIDKGTESSKKMRKLYEKLGDLILSYEGQNCEILRQALSFYKEMLRFSVSDAERCPAFISVATTYYDLGEYKNAMDQFEKCLQCEHRIGKPTTKLVETKKWIFQCKCLSKGKLASKEDLQSMFLLLDKEIPERMRMLKYTICKYMGEAMRFFEDHSSKEYLRKADEWRGNRNMDSDDEQDSLDSGSVDEEEDSDEEVLKRCRRTIQRMNEKAYLEKRKSARNSHGESDLHEQARGDNISRLKQLIQFGFDLNVQDNGGWTPLHEAVSFGKTTNVKILLKAGARVDLASKEGFNENEVSGGLTPLMDALAGIHDPGKSIETSLEIAEILFRHSPKQVVKESVDGWTAVHFLKDALNMFDDIEDVQYINRAKKLLHEMEEEMKKRGKEVKDGLPSTQRRRFQGNPRKFLQKKTTTSPGEEGVRSYVNAMKRIGRRGNMDTDVMNLGNDDFDSDDNSPTRPPSPPLSCTFDEDDDVVPLRSKNSVVSPSPSILRRKSSLPSPIKRSRTVLSDDDFIENDVPEVSRKRKSKEPNSQPSKRRGFKRESFPSPLTDNDDDDDVEIQITRRKHSPKTVPPNATRRQSLEEAESADRSMRVTVSFVTSDGHPVEGMNPRLFKMLCSERVEDIYIRCKNELPREHCNFEIIQENGIQPDRTFLLSDLGIVQDLGIKCVVKKSSAQELFRAFNSAYENELEILGKLESISLSDGNLDLSMLEVDYCIQDVIRSLAESSGKMASINLSYCDLLATCPKTLAPILQNSRQIIVKASNINDHFLENLVENGSSFPSLTAIDLSDNNISMNCLTTFVSSMPSLTQLIIRGVNLKEGGEFVDCLRNMPNLTHLDVQNTNLNSSALETVFSDLESLTTLNIGALHVDLTFMPCWLPRLVNFHAVASRIVNWDSFIEWLSCGSVKKADLSCTTFSVDLVELLVERLEGTRINGNSLDVRLIKCPDVEKGWKRLEEAMLRSLEERDSPSLRLQLATNTERCLRQSCAHSSVFLLDSF